jgi:hypothetical protein
MPANTRAEIDAATAMMLYMSAQNELTNKATDNINAIRSNVVLDNLCLYIVEDTYQDLDRDETNVRTTFHYELPRGAVDGDFQRQSFGNMDKTVGDPNVFRKFLERAQEHFKKNSTRHKILILWGHGGGMVMLDEEKMNGTVLARASIAEFAEVLEQQSKLKNAFKFDIIAFDSCYMGVIEVMNQFREATPFALVSSTVVDADGYPYKKIIKDLKEKGPMLKPKAAAELIATCYDDHYKLLLPEEERYLFTCNMKKIEACVDALNVFGDELAKLLGPDENDDRVRDAINEALIAAHADCAYVPVLIFLRKLEHRLTSVLDQDKLKNLKKAGGALAKAVKASFRGQLSDGGYTPTSPLIWSPDSRGIFLRDQEAYSQLDSSKKGTAGWVSMWRKFHGFKEALSPGAVITGKFRIGLPKSVLFGLM